MFLLVIHMIWTSHTNISFISFYMSAFGLSRQEMWIQSLGREDSPGEKMATYSSILAWEIPLKRRLAGYSPWSHKESDTEHTCMNAFNFDCITLAWIPPYPHTNRQGLTKISKFIYKKIFFSQLEKHDPKELSTHHSLIWK